MKKLIPILLVIVLVLGYIVLNQRSKIIEQKQELKIAKSKTDTILLYKEIKIPVPYKEETKPQKLIMYQDTGSIQYKFLKPITSGWILFNNNKTDSVTISDTFLKLYPHSEKLLSFDLTKNKLNLQLLGINGIPKEKRYQIDVDRYNYRYVNNTLTHKKNWGLKLYPEIEYSVRPLNNFHDLSVGLNLDTRKFNYVIGINGYWYPQFQSMGYDLKLTLRYSFK